MQDEPEGDGSRHVGELIAGMVDKKVLSLKESLKEIQAFMETSEEIGFEGKNRKEVYGWVRETLVAQMAKIVAAHIYNLRRTGRCRKRLMVHQKTKRRRRSRWASGGGQGI